MKGLQEFYRLKVGYHKPKLYLGADVKEWIFLDQPDGKYWTLSSACYVKEAIKNIEFILQQQGCTLRKSQ
jgi:hypothetical protein